MEAKTINEVLQADKVKGRHHYSKVDLEGYVVTMEEVVRMEKKDLSAKITALI